MMYDVVQHLRSNVIDRLFVVLEVYVVACLRNSVRMRNDQIFRHGAKLRLGKERLDASRLVVRITIFDRSRVCLLRTCAI